MFLHITEWLHVPLYSLYTCAHAHTDLVIIALIVVHVENAVELCVSAQAECSFPGRCKPLSGCLTGKALHLDIEELPEVTEPLNQLGSDTAIELCREKQNRQVNSGSISNDGIQ